MAGDDISTAIECLFDDLKALKDLVTEVRDVMREMLELLKNAAEGE